MDLSVTHRVVRPGPDSTMLAPHHPFFLGPFPQFSLQYNLEQMHREMDQEKREELRQLMHKSKNEQSAVASPLVKQKLRGVILKKQAALDRSPCNTNNSAPRGYRVLGPTPDVPAKPQMASAAAASPAPDQRKDLALRRTVSEPTLKWKPKKYKGTRQGPLQRKASAPPAIKHRTPDPLDSSPSSSSTPVSGCSSPNDSLLSDSGSLPLTAGLAHESQRQLLQDGTLAHFSLSPGSSALPTITAGLPAQADRDPAGQRMSRGLPQVYLPVDGSSPSSLGQYLQPVLMLEPHTGLLHTQLLSVHGLSPISLPPQQQRQQSQASFSSPSRAPEGSVFLSAPHRPVFRTRSEPLPHSQSPQPGHPGHAPTSAQHHLLQQYHSSVLLERLRQTTHLGKLMSKSSEKPRLTQIPSEDMDLEETGSEAGSGLGSGPGSVCEDSYHRRRTSGASTDSVYDTESTTSSRESLAEYTPTSLRSEQQRQVIRRPDSLGVSVLVAAHKPLFRTQSSPASTSLPPPQPPAPAESSLTLANPAPETPVKLRFTTGLVYDPQMQKHQCTCGDNSRHPEHAGRVQSIWSRLQERGLRSHCERIRSRKATLEELQSVHSEKHVLLYGTSPINRLKLDSRKQEGILSHGMFVMLPCGGVGVDNDTVWNEVNTSTASRLAAGCVTDLALKVAQGELKNGFAVVRPPGHHANRSFPMGFCIFNSVAIAAKQLQQKLSVSKILIVDWDVHHGNGTQEAFYKDPSVLYISLHRYDDGNFFPGSGDPAEVGFDAGEGFNVNIAWTGGLDPPMGDAEYLAAFRTVVMPIAHEFSPDVVLVSAGFDAVDGHAARLGGYRVSAKCFGFLTRQLMSLAGGRVVLALEGGHDLTAICDASEACVSALLDMEMEPLSQAVLEKSPCPNAVRSLQRVIQVQGEFWQSVRPLAPTVAMSYLQAQRMLTRQDSDSETVSALASLSMGVLTPDRKRPEPHMVGDEDSM